VKAEVKEEKKEEGPKKKKPKIVKTELSITRNVIGLSSLELEALIECERRLTAADVLADQTTEAMNAYESYILESRRLLSEQWGEYVEELAKEQFSAQLTKGEDWLWDEAQDETLPVFVEKLDELRAVGDKFKYRYNEAQSRPEAITSARSVIDRVQADASSGPEVEKFSHIEQADKDKVLVECRRVADWLTEKCDAQDKLKKSDDPVMTVQEIRSQADGLESFAAPIMNKPKPKPKPAPEPAKEEPAKEAAKEGEAPAEAPKEGEAPAPAATEGETEPAKDMEVEGGID